MNDEFPRVTLPAETVAALQAADRLAAATNEELDRAERCGLNCKAYRKTIREQRDRLQRLNAEYPADPAPAE